MKNIFNLPPRTVFGRGIPKNAFDERINTRQKRLLSDVIFRIRWTNKLDTQTTNLRANKVKEIQVFYVELKQKNKVKNVLSLIDKAIPYHIIFVVVHEGELMLYTSAKHQHPARIDEPVIDCVFCTKWMDEGEADLQFRLERSLDDLFIDICRQISQRSKVYATYDEFIKIETEINSIAYKVSQLESQVKKEKQFNRRVELNLKLARLKEELQVLYT